jgi:eukaryotic-like serine/threonine-protein kinase
MEYLEGETLEQRLKKGALPLDQALELAIQIADALAAAHRSRIIHRDLKPGNIMLVRRGGPSGPPAAKLLDFGLAKTSPVVASAALSMLPTTPPATMTARGTILGTFQYMAPEQLEGQEADARTDIFAFGAVLYEMVTGKKAFEGKSQASLIAAILEHEPTAISSLQPMAPPSLAHVVTQCLAKAPDERWQTAGDVVRELKWVTQLGSQQTSVPADHTMRPLMRERLAWVAALAVAALVAARTTMWGLRPGAGAVPAEMRLDVVTPTTTDPISLAISPDGQKLVFVAASEGRPQLWLRSLDSVMSRPLAQTDGAVYPFWSPDNRTVAFFADGRLKRIDIDGGGVQTLATALNARGGTWSRDGTILFAPIPNGPILRMPAIGGEPTAVTRLEPQQSSHRFPQFLHDGRHFMYYVGGSPDARGIYVSELDGAERRRLLEADSAAVEASSGQLLYVRQGTLVAQPFDPVRLTLTGNSFPVADDARLDVASNVAAVSASAAGPIAYRSGLGVGQRQLAWFDRTGKEISTVAEPDVGSPNNPTLSPDGRRIAVQRVVNGNADIWLLEIARGVLSRFTFEPTTEFAAVWSPDGSRIVFNSDRKGQYDLYQKAASGAGKEELLLATPQLKTPLDWSSDGHFLMYRSLDSKAGWDLWALPLDTEKNPIPLVQTPFEERDAQFSPDGKWIAYQSNESGRFEIYVQPFFGLAGKVGGKWQVSTNGGAQVRWKHDAKELFYVAPDGRLIAVPIQLASDGQGVEVGAAVPLFATHIGGSVPGPNTQQYIVSRDGERFLMNTINDEVTTSPITVILYWTAGLKK